MKMKLQFLILCYILKLTVGGKLSSYEGRIVGGTVADDGLAPYQCSIQFNGLHECGCSIISQKLVATAAHCFAHSSGSQTITVRMGTNNWKSGGLLYKANKIIPHENFNETNYSNDICLVEIEGKIEFNQKIQPIKFSNKYIKAGTVGLQTTGWGRLRKNGPNPDLLKMLKVRAISNEECKKYGSVVIHESHLCTFGPKGKLGGDGICSGDSGGPLVKNGELVGITSWAVLCAKGYPDGFTRVSYLYDWIKSHMEA